MTFLLHFRFNRDTSKSAHFHNGAKP